MTQSREALAIMDDNRPTVTFGKPRGYLVSGWMAALYGVLLVGGIVATGLLVYHLATCHGDAFMDDTTQSQLTNETNDNELQAVLTETKMTTLPADSKMKLDVRLPRSIFPDSYKISLIPFIKENNFTFHGEVRIVLNVTEDTTNITLHINDIKIDEESVNVLDLTNGDEKLVVTKHSNDSLRQFYIMNLNRPLMKGKQYELFIKYIGNLNDILQGFYRSSYTVANQTRWIAVTQFQPTDARRAFPCFDEPALKAKFTLSIARPKTMISISNMPRDGDPKTVVGLPDYAWDHYVQSVPMSTYLVAWVVSDFDHIDEGRFSVWAREEALTQARYALDIGPKILTYFEQYFNIKFPLPKMDMIALPDFAAGAMENWGLITYRETAMLYTPGVSTNSNKQSVATVISHELAHQWFGNLVTPSWWTDLWLNEGFASYVEYLGVDAVEPSWKILEQFVIYDLQNVLSLDALKSSHRISIEVNHPDEINEIFDRISYGKGASIIRMMDHFLTTDVFKRGITNYLNARAYGSATQNDLWAALTSQAHKDNALDKSFTVKNIMDTWTLQTGFPVLTVTRDYDSNSLELSQERFLLHNDNNTKSTASDLWWIPISYTTLEQPDFETTKPSQWLRATPTLSMQNIKAGQDHWVIFNIQQTGFYRVNYDARNWEMLIKHLSDPGRFKQISTINRAQLIDDAMNLARGERLPYTTALSVTRYLKHEEEFLPWKAALIVFGYIDSMLVRTGNYEAFQMYVMNLISNLYSTVGFTDNKDDDQLTVYKRVNALNWACGLGHDDCVRNSVLQFQNWRSSPDPDTNNPISANLKNVVYCTAVRVGGQDEWDFAWQRYKKTNVGSEKDLLLGALGCSRETWILSRYLDWAISEKSGIRKQDAARVFASVASNVIGQSLAYNFLRDQWERIRSYLGSSLFTINNIVRATTKRINTQRELDDLLQFAALHRSELGAATRAVDQAIEQAEANIKWMKNNSQVITEWLTNTTSSFKTSIS